MSRESKNLHQARAYARQYKSEDEAAFLIETIRKEIPNSRLMNYKYLYGLVRMSLGGELKTGNDIADINRSLEYIASDAHTKEYDRNFNGDDIKTLADRFAEAVHGAVRDDMDKISKLDLGKINNSYSIIPIPDYETASKYADFTSWCITHYPNMYEAYTNDGLGTFYFCLKDGYDKIEEKHVGNDPLDEYGLSMIAVSVRADGSMNTCTCRWNHDNGGGDAVMTTEELSKLLGVNFYKLFHAPKLPEEIKKVKVLLDNKQIVTVGEFNHQTMTAIGVEVKDNLYITLKDCVDENGCNWMDWYKAKDKAKEVFQGSFLPSVDDWQMYLNNKKLINGALAAVGGLSLHTSNYYWSSSEFSSSHAGYVHTHYGHVYYRHKYRGRCVRAFLAV